MVQSAGWLVAGWLVALAPCLALKRSSNLTPVQCSAVTESCMEGVCFRV